MSLDLDAVVARLPAPRGMALVRENATGILALRGDGVPSADIFAAMGGRNGTGVSKASFATYLSRVARSCWIGKRDEELTPPMRERMLADMADVLGGQAAALLCDHDAIEDLYRKNPPRTGGIRGALVRRFCEVLLSREKIKKIRSEA